MCNPQVNWQFVVAEIAYIEERLNEMKQHAEAMDFSALSEVANRIEVAARLVKQADIVKFQGNQGGENV